MKRFKKLTIYLLVGILASNNSVRDLSPLYGMQHLETIYLSYNNIISNLHQKYTLFLNIFEFFISD